MDRDADVVDVAMSHPAQRAAVPLVTDLVTQLRAACSTNDLYEFQRDLLGAMLGAQAQQAQATRNLHRSRRGRDTAPAISGDWAVEQLVWDRIVRQLRTVGDALAWRVFDFDRRFVTVLSQNAPVSPMFGKPGLAYELGEVDERWRVSRQFCLLHDLTSVVRVADMTAFTAEGARLVEVKASPNNKRPEQTRRAQGAIAVLTRGAPLHTETGELDVLYTGEQFTTHLPAVARALAAADEDGVAWSRIGRQLVVMTISADAAMKKGFETQGDEAASRQDRAFTKAEMHQTQHHLTGHRLDTHTRDRGLAPYTIYPFPPEVCARLTTDYLVVRSYLGWDRVADAFRDLGYDVACPFDPRHGQMDSDTPVAVVSRRDRTMTIHAWGLQQVQFEFLTVERFAAGVDSIWDYDMRDSNRRSGVLTFANEKATWR